MTVERTIEFRELELTVIGEYSPKYIYHDRSSPDEPEMFEWEQVLYKGVDVTDLIYALDGEEDIEDEVLKQHYR